MVLSNSRLRDGKVSNLVSSLFMHADLFHLAFNMLALHSFGSTAVYLLGGRRFYGLYFASGLLGGITQLQYNRFAPTLPIPASRYTHYDTNVVGASAAISGVIMYTCLTLPRNEISLFFFINIQNRYFVPGFMLLTSYFMYTGSPNSSYAHAAHLGGSLTGITYFLLTRGRSGFRWN